MVKFAMRQNLASEVGSAIFKQFFVSSDVIPNQFIFESYRLQKLELYVYRSLNRIRHYVLEICMSFLFVVFVTIWMSSPSESNEQVYQDSVARGRFDPDDSIVEHEELLRRFGEKRVFNVPSAQQSPNSESKKQEEEPMNEMAEIKAKFYTAIKETADTKFVSTEILKKITKKSKSKKRKPMFPRTNSHYSVIHSMLDELNWAAQLRVSPWLVAKHWVQPNQITPSVCTKLGSVLYAMATSAIMNVSAFRAGSNLKVLLHLDGGQLAVFKPLLHPITEVIEGPSYVGADRHYGEIASFHLNRILGFNRAPIVVGRKVNLRREMLPVAMPEIAKTFFNNGENMCFYGICTHCRKEFSACAKGDMLEGSLTLFLPLESRRWTLVPGKNPWIRTYQDGFVAKWQVDKKYCKEVIADKIYHRGFNKGRKLLDLIDMSIFDFLIGNGDRAQYEMFNVTDAALLLLDNGKSFNNPNLDDIEILAPLYECCKLRKSTFKRLRMFAGGALSESLDMLLSHDPLSPILNEAHLKALDRRLDLVLRVTDLCSKKKKTKFLVDEDVEG